MSRQWSATCFKIHPFSRKVVEMNIFYVKRVQRALKWTHFVWNENKEYRNADISDETYVSMTNYIHIVRKLYYIHWNLWASGRKTFWSYFNNFVTKRTKFDYIWFAIAGQLPVNWFPSWHWVQEVLCNFIFVHIFVHSNKHFHRFKKWPRNKTKKIWSLSRILEQ